MAERSGSGTAVPAGFPRVWPETAPESDKSYRVLEALQRNPSLSQREISRHTHISLGMVNMLLRRLANAGYVKISRLNSDKIRYLLSPAGLAFQMERSCQYVLRTIRTYQNLRERTEAIVDHLLRQGKRRFILIGSNEISRLTELVCREKSTPRAPITCRIEAGPPRESADLLPDEIVVDCRMGKNPAYIGLRLLEKLLGPPGKEVS